MKYLLSAKLAGQILIATLVLMIIFHAFVLFNVIPYEIVWAGRITDSSSLLMYEGFAIFLTFIFILIISMKLGYLHANKYAKAVNFGVWLVFTYFTLNTIGNFASANITEKLIFAPLTIFMALLAFRVALEK
jgi:hypothetical protein